VHEDDESGEDGHEELLLPCQTTWMDWIMYVHLVVFRLVGVDSCAGSFIHVKLVDVR
jgi:hypothetical protein